MSKLLRRISYEWHLKRVERISVLLNTDSYYSGSEVRNLTLLRMAHEQIMLRLSQRNAPKPNAKKKV